MHLCMYSLVIELVGETLKNIENSVHWVEYAYHACTLFVAQKWQLYDMYYLYSL